MTDRDRLHAPDPRDEVRECFADECADGHIHGNEWVKCLDCEGRGYVVGRWVEIDMGVEASDVAAGLAKQEWEFVPARSQDVIELGRDDMRQGWVWSIPSRATGCSVTAEEALLAARCAYWGVEIHCIYRMYYTASIGEEVHDRATGLPTPNAALCSAIDAREE